MTSKIRFKIKMEETELKRTNLPEHRCPPAYSAAPSCPPGAVASGPAAPHISSPTVPPFAAAPVPELGKKLENYNPERSSFVVLVRMTMQSRNQQNLSWTFRNISIHHSGCVVVIQSY